MEDVMEDVDLIPLNVKGTNNVYFTNHNDYNNK